MKHLYPQDKPEEITNIRQKIAAPVAISALYKADSFSLPVTNYPVYHVKSGCHPQQNTSILFPSTTSASPPLIPITAATLVHSLLSPCLDYSLFFTALYFNISWLSLAPGLIPD